MPLDAAIARDHLRNFRFDQLFIEEMGWDRHRSVLAVEVDGTIYTLNALAEKRGLVVYHCEPDSQGRIPLYSIRRKIERRVAKTAYEHLIIYTDAGSSEQVWQWVKRELGRSANPCREHRYHISQTGEALVQKLQAIVFEIEDEESLTLPVVSGRMRRAFDLERVTKRFYELFKAEHDAFLRFIQGIPDADLQAWYTSVMLNRLMFIYFIQKKGFLDGDRDYLRRKLQQSQAKGQDRYYRDFLCPLFFAGFAQKPAERSPEINAMLGQVPYLNGGIFTEHYLEKLHGRTIVIPDAAFEKIFNFFEPYHWHLDERPLRADNEINPDVLGYIFEKYINQKQMGAYYTKEDITEYIAKNTIIPFLFDAAEKKCAVAFKAESALWRLLAEDPDRYIYDAVKHGLTVNARTQPPTPLEKPLDLPPEIAAGIGDVSQRTHWNKTAPEEYGLPTEIWREVVTRRQRYEEVRAKLAAGEITSINDLITYNLNIRQFAADVIDNCEGPELLRAIFYTIAGREPEKSHEHPWPALSVLDPTCGSGAFLFAALNILEPLYEACLQRMEVFVQELDRSGQTPHPEKFRDFRSVLARIEEHPNRRYFILKSIIVNNLYGVDIMPEAVEICKLRLFLKLVAQVEAAEKIEALPDIDFNIRSGNTLVGFVHPQQVQQAISREASGQGKLVFGEAEEAYQKILVKAADVDQYFESFRRAQLQGNGAAPAAHKQELTRRLGELSAALDVLLAGEYGISASTIPKKKDYEARFAAWRASHQPFHWFAEFYGIMQRGGFDVIIGNPPYVEIKVLNEYELRGYHCITAGNLYALVMERCLELCNKYGREGLIVPVSSISTDRYENLQRLISKRTLYYSSFDDRPSRLFDGLEHNRLSIHLISTSSDLRKFSTKYNKWTSTERKILFDKLHYVESFFQNKILISGSMPKLHDSIEMSIVAKLFEQTKSLQSYFVKDGKFNIYYSRKLGYFLQVLNFIPTVIDGNGNQRPPSEFKQIDFNDLRRATIALCLLNSNLFYYFVTILSDCRHVNKREVESFPVELDKLEHGEYANSLVDLADRLMTNINENSEHKKMSFKHDTLTVQCIFPKRSKPIIDEIDRVLAQHYGFTDEELDFIINYDIKYRMGAEAEE